MINNINKACKKHGVLTEDQIHNKGKSKTGKQYYGCKLCKKEAAKKYTENNYEKIKIKLAEYHQKRKLKPEFKIKKKKWMHDYQKRQRLLNPEKIRKKDRENKKIWTNKHIDRIKKEFKSYIDDLHPYYVKAYLKKHYGFDNPSDELVHAKATLMLLKREIMKLNVNMGRNKYVAKTRKYKIRNTSGDTERKIIEGTTQDFIKRKNN